MGRLLFGRANARTFLSGEARILDKIILFELGDLGFFVLLFFFREVGRGLQGLGLCNIIILQQVLFFLQPIVVLVGRNPRVQQRFRKQETQL